MGTGRNFIVLELMRPRRTTGKYFHGDNGAELGASHQTGWTGVIARTIDLFGRLNPEDALRISKDELAARMTRRQVAGS